MTIGAISKYMFSWGFRLNYISIELASFISFTQIRMQHAQTNKEKAHSTIYNALTLYACTDAHALSHHKYMILPTFLSNFLPARYLFYIFINNNNNKN